jgi:hypothetical protein
MLTNYGPDSNFDELTEIEIYAAIGYLDPDPTSADERHADDRDKDSRIVIWVGLYITVLGSLAFFWFYWQ